MESAPTHERMKMHQPVLLSIEKAAEALSIGRSKTYELIGQGKLVTVTIGRRRLVRMDSLQALARGEAA
jgi:excisionase family DNA binding protein